MNTAKRLSIAALASVAALSLLACEEVTIKVGNKNGVKGSGVSASETRSLPEFTGVDLAGVGKLVLKVGEGSAYSVKVTADDNLLPLLETKVTGNTLMIQPKGSVSFSNTVGFTYEVTAPKIEKIESSGAASVEGTGFRGGKLAVDVSGVGSVKLAGRVDEFRADLSGAGSLNSSELIANDVRVELSGVGSAEVQANQKMRGSVSGLGSISWRGDATDVKTDVSGLGSVRKTGDVKKTTETNVNV